MKTFIGLDLCSGAGGLSKGFMSARHRNSRFAITVANDVNYEASQTFTKNHKSTFVLGSLASRKIKREIEEASSPDIIIGGPPCQGFSHVNKRTRTISNPLNGLVLDFVEMVRRLEPTSFVMENVPGLLSMQNGVVIKKVIKRFQSMGYENTDYWVLNAADYGVPQKRRRVFVVGSKLGKIVPPKQTHEKHETVGNAILDLPEILPGKRVSDVKFKNHITTASNLYTIKRFGCVPQGGNWQDIPQAELSSTGKYLDPHNTHGGLYKRLDADKPSPTITNFRKSMIIHPTQDRLLSVREAARLQTFPDSFEFCGSLSSMQQQVSDAVPVMLAKAVAKSMLEHMA